MEYRGIINLIDDSNSSESPLFNSADEMHPLGEECLTTHDVAMHFHPYLTIIIDDVEYPIPEDTGIDTETCPGAMHMTHTHDSTGKIHVEGHQVVDVPLEVFFDVWGKHFDETGIFEYRDGTVEMTVDGIISNEYQNLLLADGQNIVIKYTSN
ncbi:MAG: hypothetical protein MKZ58_07430 [Candidatus Poseidoniaceae archaeon]|nr:hypothetical protein [Candidatus Poseidoniaceae archaeon]|tara:strand:+ start:830 stop:1288 length:459 start_codon:yes stop_codon:yes gene_type:complete